MEEIETENENIVEVEITPLTKPKRKSPTGPRTEKQKENIKKAIAVRRENIEKAKKEKEIKMAKIYFDNKLKEDQKINQEEIVKEFPKKNIKQIVKYVEETDSEEEIIYMKKPKKKSNEKIVYLSEEEDDEPQRTQFKKPSRIIRKEDKQPSNNQQSFNLNDFFI